MRALYRFAWAWFIAATLAVLPAAAHATTYYAYAGVAKNASGVAINAATVTVYAGSSGTTVATIYSDGSGSSQANPFTTASNGTYTIYLVSGRYRIVAVDGSSHAFTAYVTEPPVSYSSGLTSPVGAADGGTGRTTLTAHDVVVGAGTSQVALISPSTSGKVLTSNGTGSDPSFQTPAGASPGGSDTQVQYNDSSAFGGDSGMTYNKSTHVQTLTGGLLSPYVVGSSAAAGQLLLRSTTNTSKGGVHIEGTTNGTGVSLFYVSEPIGYDDALVLGHGAATDYTNASSASFIAQALYSGNYATQWIMLDGQNSRIVMRQDLELKWTNSNDRSGDTAATIGQYNAGALGVKATGGVGGSWILYPGTAPSSPIEGEMYYNAASHVPCIWNGSAWKKFDGSTACP